MTKITYRKPSKTAQKLLDKIATLEEWKIRNPGKDEKIYHQTVVGLQNAAKGSVKSISGKTKTKE